MPVVTTGAGLPGVYMKEWVPAGIKVVPVVPSVAIAKRVAREGATAVIAEGCESGGHVGELTTMALVPQVVDAAVSYTHLLWKGEKRRMWAAGDLALKF